MPTHHAYLAFTVTVYKYKHETSPLIILLLIIPLLSLSPLIN